MKQQSGLDKVVTSPSDSVELGKEQCLRERAAGDIEPLGKASLSEGRGVREWSGISRIKAGVMRVWKPITEFPQNIGGGRKETEEDAVRHLSF